jgi:hypothetical protein
VVFEEGTHMSAPIPESPYPGKPTADDLAGTPVCVEENGPMVHGRKSPSTTAITPAQGAPLADDLAGVPVCAEGFEDLTVRPQRPRPQAP